MMGPLKYALLIGLPSITKNGYDTPWEYTASVFGGSNLATQSSISVASKTQAWNYLCRAVSINPLMWLTCFLEYLSML